MCSSQDEKTIYDRLAKMDSCGAGHICEVPDCGDEARVIIPVDGQKRRLCRKCLLNLIAYLTGDCPALLQLLDVPVRR